MSEKKKWSKGQKIAVYTIFGLLSFVILIIAIAPNPEKERIEQAKAAPPIEIGAADLYNQFEQNEIAAGENFAGRPILTSGTITEIAKDITGRPYIILNGAVQCSFASKDASQFAHLSKGGFVKIKGLCSRKMVYIQMKECELVNE